MKSVRLDLPADAKTMKTLKAGDFVKVCGKLTVARDLTLEKIFRDGRVSFLKNASLYFCGPVIKHGRLTAAGPTTSSRMDGFAPKLVESGVRVMIGKGRIAEVAVRALRGKAVYLEAPGGAGALLASKITEYKILDYRQLGAQALMEFTVDDFPAIVALDAAGKNIWKN